MPKVVKGSSFKTFCLNSNVPSIFFSVDEKIKFYTRNYRHLLED